ncbi:MAG: carbohydrate porin, partial [Enterobacteriaceae bacterium]
MSHRNKWLVAATIALGAFSLPSALAQDERIEQPEVQGLVLGMDPPTGHLFGDWLGMRSTLEQNGFTFNAAYLNQMAYNAGGGYDRKRKVAYIDQFSFTFAQDLQSLTGIPGARIEGNIVNRNHDSNLTAQRLQDPNVPFNDIA